VIRKFAFTSDADRDSLEIWQRIAADDSPMAADRLLARIYDKSIALAICRE